MSRHYQSGLRIIDKNGTLRDLEVIDIIEHWNLPRNLANVCKYTLRHDRKGETQRDLEKLADYAYREAWGSWAPRPNVTEPPRPTSPAALKLVKEPWAQGAACEPWCGQTEMPIDVFCHAFNYHWYCSDSCVDIARCNIIRGKK